MIEFKLNEKESELAEKFMQEHRHPEVYKGTIGGHIRYTFVPTAIGDGVSIHCSICDAEEDITNYDNW